MNAYSDPHAIRSARSALLLLALPEPGQVERLCQEAERALRATYGDLNRGDVSLGELRRASFCAGIRRMTLDELHDASRRLDD